MRSKRSRVNKRQDASDDEKIGDVGEQMLSPAAEHGQKLPRLPLRGCLAVLGGFLVHLSLGTQFSFGESNFSLHLTKKCDNNDTNVKGLINFPTGFVG